MKTNYLSISLLVLFLFVSCRQSNGLKGDKQKNKNQSLPQNSIIVISDSLKNMNQFQKSNSILLKAKEKIDSTTSLAFLLSINNRLAYNYRRMGIYDSALYYCSNSILIATTKDDLENINIAQTYYILGLLYREEDTDSSYKYLNKALELRQKLLGNNSPLVGDVYNNLGAVFLHIGKYEKAFEFYKEALRLRKQRGNNHPSVASTYMNIANGYQDLEEMEKSLVYYDSALVIQKSISPNSPMVASILLNKANTYVDIGKIDKSIELYKEALELYINIYGNEHPYVAIAYNNLGLQYITWNDYSKASEYLLESIRIKKKLGGRFKKELVDNYLNLGKLYINLKEYDSAIEVLKEGIKVNNQLKNKRPETLGRIYFYLSRIYFSINKTHDGINYAKSAFKIYQDNYSKISFELANANYDMAEAYLEIMDLDRAEIHINKSLKYFTKNRNSFPLWIAYSQQLKSKIYYLGKRYDEAIKLLSTLDENYSTPEGELDIKKINKYGLGELLINSKYLTAKCYLKMNDISTNTVLLKKAKHEIIDAENLFEGIRSLISYESSKIELSKKMENVFNLGVEVAFLLNEISPNISCFETALNFSENKKSLALLETLAKTNTIKYVGIADSLILKQKRIKSKIIENDRLLKELETGSANENRKIEKLRNENFSLRVKYEKEEKRLSKENPLYSSLYFQIKKLQVSSIQSDILKENQTLIEFSVANKYLYSFIVSKNNYHFIRTPSTVNVNELVTNLTESITMQKKEEYTKYAYAAYELLIKPIEPFVNTDRLVIINEGVLGYVPYDALISRMVSSETSYKNYPYLVNKYSFGYAFSISVLSESEAVNNIINTIVGIAPLTK